MVGRRSGRYLLGLRVAVEDIEHVRRGPRGLLEVGQHLVLDGLIADGTRQSGTELVWIVAQGSAKTGHNLLEFTDESIIIFSLPFHQVQPEFDAIPVNHLAGCGKVAEAIPVFTTSAFCAGTNTGEFGADALFRRACGL